MSRVLIQPTGLQRHPAVGVYVYYDVVVVNEDAGTSYVLASKQETHIASLPDALQQSLDLLLLDMGAHMNALAGLDSAESPLERAARDGRPIEKDLPLEEAL